VIVYARVTLPDIFFLMRPQTPSNPVPNRKRLDGSGTGLEPGSVVGLGSEMLRKKFLIRKLPVRNVGLDVGPVKSWGPSARTLPPRAPPPPGRVKNRMSSITDSPSTSRGTELSSNDLLLNESGVGEAGSEKEIFPKRVPVAVKSYIKVDACATAPRTGMTRDTATVRARLRICGPFSRGMNEFIQLDWKTNQNKLRKVHRMGRANGSEENMSLLQNLEERE
jgi:hypothetical protein